LIRDIERYLFLDAILYIWTFTRGNTLSLNWFMLLLPNSYTLRAFKIFLARSDGNVAISGVFKLNISKPS
jgi:hypothetical protein